MKKITEEEFNKHLDRKRKNHILETLYYLQVGESMELKKKEKWFSSDVNVYIGNILRAAGRGFITRVKHDNTGWVIKRIK